MKQMRHHLRRLPKEDYDRAIEYFEEYFEEAGPECEQQAIEDLGLPEIAADQIIRDLAMENAAKPNVSVKRGMSAVWVGILAVFAAPIGLPLALAAGAVLLAIVLVVLSIIFAVFITAVTLAASAVPLLIGSIWLLFTSPVNGLANIGLSLIAVGIGIWIIKGCIWLCRWFLNLMTRLFGRIARRGSNHEE
nr:DUF1700 domain-containing protein [Ruminococcus sp. OA3]